MPHFTTDARVPAEPCTCARTHTDSLYAIARTRAHARTHTGFVAQAYTCACVQAFASKDTNSMPHARTHTESLSCARKCTRAHIQNSIEERERKEETHDIISLFMMAYHGSSAEQIVLQASGNRGPLGSDGKAGTENIRISVSAHTFLKYCSSSSVQN